MSKKIISALLIIIFMFCSITVAFAENGTARLYTVYGDGMLFSQNKEAIFAGEGAQPGSTVKVQLFNENAWPINSASAKVADDGTFEVSFIAPAGGYSEYTVVLTENGDEFARIKNVVFGELWIASGQSNMMLPLAGSTEGAEMISNNVKLSKWLRVCYEPAYPKYNGKESIPVDPQNDIVGAVWLNGEDPSVYSMSAVAYFFAEKLMTELDMPVGILNSSLGGSSIKSWLSREAIDADSTLKSELESGGYYIEKSAWNEDEADIYIDMTANYNLRTHAYRNFRPSGMIWYQGETDLIYGLGTDVYAHCFDALQQMYTDMFDSKNGFFPIVYTQIAPYSYGDHALSEWNLSYTQLQSAIPESRAMITLYDLTLTYSEAVGVIHPSTKQPVGERMAKSALSMVYGNGKNHTAASLSTVEIKDSSVYVTFKDIGEGIKSDTEYLNGFAICGADGIYVNAKAEIVSKDTVRIWSDNVTEPISASYAYCTLNTYSSLYTTVDGEKFMPVSPFVTKEISDAVYWTDKTWADCELEKAWHLLPDPYSAEFDTWKADGAEVVISESDAYSGNSGLNVSSDERKFTVKPVQIADINNEPRPFRDFDTNWTDYGSISFYVRNNSSSDITLDEMRIYTSAYFWYAPAVKGTADTEFVIPADGEWHKITLDLDSLYLLGNECGFTYANEKLNYVFKFMFRFSGENADISLDEFSFSPSVEALGTRFETDVAQADNPFEFISALFTMLIGMFANIFA